MDSITQDSPRRDFLADCQRIHREWDAYAKALDTDHLISLYAPDAVLETPLVPAIFVRDVGRTNWYGGTGPTIGSPTAKRP